MTNDKGKDDSFVPFYRNGANTYMSLKVSKDGDSRKEDVEVGKGMYEEDKVRNVGWQVRRKIFGRKDGGDDGAPVQQ